MVKRGVHNFMISVELDRQLMISLDDNVGSLAEVTNMISASGINMVAICAYAANQKVAIMFVTEDNNGARKILEDQGYNVREEEVILLSVENKPGALQAVTDKIAEAGINLKLIYGSVAKEGKVSRIVLISENNMDVMMMIRMEFGRSSG